MLYMTGTHPDGSEFKIIVLESVNLDEIRKGHPAKTPDGSVLIAWCPDIVWLTDKLMDLEEGDGAAIGRLIDEAAKRPQKGPRPTHPRHDHKFGGPK